MTVATNLGTGGAVLDAQYGSSASPNTNEPLLLGHTGENYLYLPGVAGNTASTPDAAALDITGDIEIVVRVAMDDWSASSSQKLISKFGVNPTYDLNMFGGLAYFSLRTGGVSSTNDSVISPPAPLANGQNYWLRFRRVATTGVVTMGHAADQGTEPTVYTAWTVVGGAQTAGNLDPNNDPLLLGSGVAGKVYRAIVRDGIGGTTVFDADFTSGITSGAQTTFTESSANAATVTINRSTAGRKACAVVRPTWLLGTDDYFEVPDNALLDFGAGDDFTVVAVVRQWGTGGSFMAYASKQNPDSNSNVGWGQVRNTGAATSLFDLKDGSGVGSGTAFAQAYTSGAVSVLSSQREGAVARHQLNNATPTTGTASTLTLANSLPMRIGANPAGAPFYADMELLAVAVFRRALTAAELSTIATYYGAI